jgi:hypothetical protein
MDKETSFLLCPEAQKFFLLDAQYYGWFSESSLFIYVFCIIKVGMFNLIRIPVFFLDLYWILVLTLNQALFDEQLLNQTNFSEMCLK